MSITKIQKQKIHNIAEQMNLKYLYLFGSQARDKTGHRSDFDFAVKFSNRTKNTLKARLRLMNELTDIMQKEEIDVVDIEAADPILGFNIIRDGKLVYVNNKKEQVYDKFIIMRTYLDRRYYYDRHFKMKINHLAKKGMYG